MPSITSRACGICPVSHLLASAKACDAIVGVSPPPAAIKLRRLMHMGQMIQSHALNFYYLSAPDLLLGFDSDPATRNVFGLIEKDPKLALQGVKLRKVRSRNNRERSLANGYTQANGFFQAELNGL